MIGKILGDRYELLELIGVGGMSRVYKAKCNLLNRFVAVKILKEEYNDDKEFIKRFYIESQAAASLSSPHIVSIYDVGNEENLHYIVLEYVEGATLKDVIKKNGVLAWSVALNFSLQILAALECAHKNGIVHRDIKPQNIIVTDDGVLKVTDFGIARAVNSNETKKIDTDVIGSVHYISPEQAKGIMIDARCDLYSLGIVMYEMLTGKLPYDGDNPVSVALMHLSSEPISIKELNLAVPNELVRIATKAMQRDVLNRYQSAKEMSEELLEFKKVENLTTKENEDAFIQETVAMVKLAKKDSEIDTSVQAQTQEQRRIQRKGMASSKTNIPESADEDSMVQPIEVQPVKQKKEPSKETEKIAFWAAIGTATLIVLLLVVFALNFIFNSGTSSPKGEEKFVFLKDMQGQNIEDVREYLEGAGFEYIITDVEDSDYENGFILRQEPYGDQEISTSTLVELEVVKNEDSEELIWVPDVLQMRYDQAIKELEDAGFKVNMIEEVSATDVKVGCVFQQSPGASEKAEKGSTVTIRVSAGPEIIVVPDFVGMTEEEAIAQASELGLNPRVREKEGTENVGEVIKQSIPKNTEVEINKKEDKTVEIELTVVIPKEEADVAPSASPEIDTPPTATPKDGPNAQPIVPTDSPESTTDGGSEDTEEEQNSSEDSES